MSGFIITGGGSGIGATIAQQADAAGHKVGVMDANLEAATAVCQTLRDAQPLVANVNDASSVTQAFDRFGDFTVLVNCAGILRPGPLMTLDEQDFRAVIDTNLIGTYLASQAAAQRMQATGGSIVNLSSINASQPSPDTGAYVASKAAVEAMTRQMSLEWAVHNIRVNAVSPGFVNTGMAAPFYKNQEVRERRAQAVPLQRLGTALDIANVILFLTTDQAAYITGQTLSVDGGLGHSLLRSLPRE